MVHIYAFGSICRGQVEPGSDVDLLALSDVFAPQFDVSLYSVYTYARIRELWLEGNPFAWHLSLESRLIFTSNGLDFLGGLGTPSPYRKCLEDCLKFRALLLEASSEILAGSPSLVFELGTAFLAIRNIATCYALGVEKRTDFSRRSAPNLKDLPLPISDDLFDVFKRARLLSTRGHGQPLPPTEIQSACEALPAVAGWMDALVRRAERERV